MTRSLPKHSHNAQQAFIAKKAEIDEAIRRLQELSENHFNVSPDEVHWGHVGTLGYYAEKLRQITDQAFQEGEWAE